MVGFDQNQCKKTIVWGLEKNMRTIGLSIDRSSLLSPLSTCCAEGSWWRRSQENHGLRAAVLASRVLALIQQYLWPRQCSLPASSLLQQYIPEVASESGARHAGEAEELGALDGDHAHVDGGVTVEACQVQDADGV